MATQLAQQLDTTATDLLGFAAALQERYEATTSAEQRKERGQFFTPPSVAAFMAGLLSTPAKRLRIVDAGAGTGTLSAAICERILHLRSPRQIEFELVEIDSAVLPLLDENMKHCRTALHAVGHEMSYGIEDADFILSNRPTFGQETLFHDGRPLSVFDAAIMNPPYFKLNKNSAHARAFERIIHGQPNIYALFMATAAAMLRPGGELVAITPRSFCNGLYFRQFRRWFFGRMTLRHAHLFESRTETFKEADVLQESLITLWEKTPHRQGTVNISTSHGADLNGAHHATEYPAKRIVQHSSGDFVIRIPGSRADAQIMDAVESWSATFVERGLRISTGPVVTFRAIEYLLENTDAADAVPLLFARNVHPFETRWPLLKNGKPLAFRACQGSKKLLVPTRNYVLLRRFSAKEERRRLTASTFLPNRSRWPSHIAIENHVNYVYHARRNLTAAETVGLAALFNSALLDRYFRTLSGNTQVNATEIRAMPFPDLDSVARLGSAVKKIDLSKRAEVERVVLGELGISGSLANEIARSAK